MVSLQPADAVRRSTLQRYWFDIPLWKRIIPALALGIVVGLLAGESAIQFKWIGDVFVRLTRMLIVPLVFLTISAGVIGLGDPKRLGSLGARSIGLFVVTAAIAATIGLTLGLVLQPGVGVSVSGAAPQTIKASKTIAEQLMGIIPINPIQAMVEGEMLAIIFFAIVFSAGVLILGERAKPVADLLGAASEVMLTLIRFVIEAAPFGVFGLIAAAVGANGPGVFVNVSLLALGTLLGCLIQTLIVQAAVVRLIANLPAVAFLRGSWTPCWWPSRPRPAPRACRWRWPWPNETSASASRSCPRCCRWGSASAATARRCTWRCSPCSRSRPWAFP